MKSWQGHSIRKGKRQRSIRWSKETKRKKRRRRRRSADAGDSAGKRERIGRHPYLRWSSSPAWKMPLHCLDRSPYVNGALRWSSTPLQSFFGLMMNGGHGFYVPGSFSLREWCSVLIPHSASVVPWSYDKWLWWFLCVRVAMRETEMVRWKKIGVRWWRDVVMQMRDDGGIW